MTEANYSFTTKLNGDLLTVRGASFEEFANNVATLVANGQAVVTDLVLLQGVGNAAPLVAPQPAAPAAQVPTQPPAPPQQQAWPQQPPAQTWQQPPAPAQPAQAWQGQPQQAGPVHVCDCGQPMKLRNSQYGSFYSCAKHQQDPSRCHKKVNV